MRTYVRMRAKVAERRRARELRGQGWSLRRIANTVGVSVSSVSVWARDIPAPQTAARNPAPASRPEGCGGFRSCGRCGLSLPLIEFSRHPSRGHQHWCKTCFRAYFRARGELHRKQSKAAKRRRRQRARSFVDEYLRSHPCVDCDTSDPLVLEFDHQRDKRSGISELLAAGWSLARLQKEMALCEVVCVNCHRRRTAQRSPSWRLCPDELEGNRRLLPGERRNLLFVRDFLVNSNCADCGENDLLVLEFDHIGAKRSTVPEMARRGCSLQTLRAEIAQCEVRCANCHRRRTRLTAAGLALYPKTGAMPPAGVEPATTRFKRPAL